MSSTSSKGPFTSGTVSIQSTFTPHSFKALFILFGLFCGEVVGSDDEGPVFTVEYQMYEVGTGGYGGKRKSEKGTLTLPPPAEAPDQVLEFQTKSISERGMKFLTPEDAQISTYDIDHPRQHFALKEDLASLPIVHGRYFYAATLRLILKHYGHSDVANFDSAKVKMNSRP
jgi:hypothetical protein